MSDSTPIRELPAEWHVGELASTASFEIPPASSDPTRINIFGYREGNDGHRIYNIPASTPVAEICHVFHVGSHNSYANDFDPVENVKRVATLMTKVAEIKSGRVEFADPAGLKFRFTDPITKDELHKVESLFPEEDQIKLGLDVYISEWDGVGSILTPILKRNLLHLWWD